MGVEESHSPLTILGVDLAWARKKPDAIVPLTYQDRLWTFQSPVYETGDDALLAQLDSYSSDVLIAIDAPTLCTHPTGSRPVDKECSSRFRKFDAGCHPVNLKLAPGPITLAKKLVQRGFANHWELGSPVRHLIEVFPHPAIVQMFQLDRTIKYKKGRVSEKRECFSVLQRLLSTYLETQVPEIARSAELNELLETPWTKKVEDLIDAHICALIGYLHLKDLTEVLGDAETGFIVVPTADAAQIRPV